MTKTISSQTTRSAPNKAKLASDEKAEREAYREKLRTIRFGPVR